MARICLAVMIAGQLQFPQGAGDRLPAIILQHGSGADDDYGTGGTLPRVF